MYALISLSSSSSCSPRESFFQHESTVTNHSVSSLTGKQTAEQQIPSARVRAELSERGNPHTHAHTYTHTHVREENKSFRMYFCSAWPMVFTTDANKTESLLANRYQKKTTWTWSHRIWVIVYGYRKAMSWSRAVSSQFVPPQGRF